MQDLIVQRPQGLYCPPGDFYIDPWRPVERAVITHAHADHARPGHAHYLAASQAEGVLRSRLGQGIRLQTLAYGQQITHHGVTLSLHPAGHVLGSAQVRLQYRGAGGGQTWVASGDYKVAPDATCTPFEAVRCDVFITESTFGLPIYRWRPDTELLAGINAWWAANAAAGRASVLMCYSFGKAQRILSGVDASIAPIIVHGAVQTLNQAYRAAGVALPETRTVEEVSDAGDFKRALVLCPPGAAAGPWVKRFGDFSDAFASGWMQVRGARRRGAYDQGFPLSDHADWPGLMGAIAATGAQRVIVTHGSVPVMVRYLSEQGLQAGAFHTEYGDAAVEEQSETVPQAPTTAQSGP
ncbi:MAG: ligase-associated DNA damage response exonuclease [Polaromonas sp.]|uniref:ligase-associated DNA damage response exonuclease n=1 Tax=Polaromonas sp. TaxID=1869339 RepID=UPI002488AD4E|nr:ligase-associated DNA damage response exonuclease [Polaromonas sp.]MDI1237944.1 ligase-associated DNA damage response exonuclease [Polaromonas sp.]